MRGGREGCARARGVRHLAPGLRAGCLLARWVFLAQLPGPPWGDGARWSHHPATFISRKWIFGRGAWTALPAQAGSRLLLVSRQTSRSITLMPVGVSARRAQCQAVAVRLCLAWVGAATRICRERSNLALLSHLGSTSWAVLHPRFEDCSAQDGWVRPPCCGRLGWRYAGAGGPCWHRRSGRRCQQESRVQAQPLPRCARCLPVFIRCPVPVVLRMKLLLVSRSSFPCGGVGVWRFLGSSPSPLCPSRCQVRLR